jgi:hypothetical protein
MGVGEDFIDDLQGLLTFRQKQRGIIAEGEAAMGKLKGPGSARSKAGGGSGGGRMDKEAKKKWDAHDAKVLIYTRVRMGCRASYSRASSSSGESSVSAAGRPTEREWARRC